MIRVLIIDSSGKAYGYDVTGWEDRDSEWYDNLLTEDLVERVNEGDIIMYFDSDESARSWCEVNMYNYELVTDDE